MKKSSKITGCFGCMGIICECDMEKHGGSFSVNAEHSGQLRRGGRGPLGSKRIHLHNVPGVVYPREFISEQVPRLGHSWDVFRIAPDWAIPSGEAAALLGCKVSAAREFMHRKDVLFCRVQLRGQGKGTCVYWDKKQVQRLARARKFRGSGKIENYIPVEEVMERLGVSRTTVRRYVKCRLLRAYPRRRASRTNGCRIVNEYLKSQVEKLLPQRRGG